MPPITIDEVTGKNRCNNNVVNNIIVVSAIQYKTPMINIKHVVLKALFIYYSPNN